MDTAGKGVLRENNVPVEKVTSISLSKPLRILPRKNIPKLIEDLFTTAMRMSSDSSRNIYNSTFDDLVTEQLDYLVSQLRYKNIRRHISNCN